MNPLAQAISEALVQFVWQGLLVAVVVAIAAFLLRHRSPNVRYLMYCCALLTLAALPVITAFELYDPLATRKAGAAAITLIIRGVWNGSASPLPRIPQPWVLRVWLLGVAFLSMRLAFLAARVRSLRHAGQPAGDAVISAAKSLARRMGMTRTLHILVSAIPDGPSVIGWFRPAILLPAATLLNLTPDQFEAILAHELAHLRRYDDVVNIVQSIVETLLFYHPAVWWISNRIRYERELCCDDLAVRTAGDALCYARALTALETLRTAPVGLALGAATSPLEYRIRRIVGQTAQNYLPSTLPGMLAIGLALTSLAIYSTPAHGSAPPPPMPVAYPEAARVNGIEGTVPVEVRIDNQGNVSHAKAMGGPRELRQAAVDSASTQHFAPDDSATAKQVNVVFQLDRPAPQTPPSTTAVPVHSGPVWRDETESNLGTAATNETDLAVRLQLLKQWEELYPVSDFKAQRAVMIAHTLLAVLSTAYGETDPAVLDAAKKAALDLSDHLDEYVDDSMRESSQQQIQTVLAYIEQATAMPKAAPEALPNDAVITATVVSQQSANRILVNLGDAPEGNAILVFDAPKVHAARRGARLEFRGVRDSSNPSMPTFVIQNPATDIVWLTNKSPKHGNVFARVFKGIFHFVKHLA